MSIMTNSITDYINHLNKVVTGLNKNQISNVVNLLHKSKNIYVIGNGGSASLSEHFVVDLIKFGNKKAYTLTNSSLYTMLVNDYGHNHSFRWIIDKICNKGDIIIGISTSGKSENILRALVGNLRIKSIFISGKNGTKIAKELDACIIVDDEHTQILEDTFSILCHMIALELGRKHGK